MNSNTAARKIIIHIKAVNSNGRDATIDPEVDVNDITRSRYLVPGKTIIKSERFQSLTIPKDYSTELIQISVNVRSSQSLTGSCQS